jgi:hypothetical protein
VELSLDLSAPFRSLSRFADKTNSTVRSKPLRLQRVMILQQLRHN